MLTLCYKNAIIDAMKSISEDIKNNSYSKVYLITGTESYLRQQAKTRLKNALCSPDDNLNFAEYRGKDPDISEIIDFANTLPFLAEKRVLIIEETNLFRVYGASSDSEEDEDGGSDDTEDEEDEDNTDEGNMKGALAAFIKDIPETACMIFVQESVDKRGSIYKAIKKAGRVVELNLPGDKDIENWIISRVKGASLQIRRSALDMFMLRVPRDLETMNQELEKLICYCLDKGEIDSEDVKAVCTERIEDKVFDMINFIVEKNRHDALLKYYDMLALKTHPRKILSLVEGQFSRILTIKALTRDGLSQEEIKQKLSLHPYAVKMSVKNGQKYTFSQLRAILERCAEYERMINQGLMDNRMSLEVLIAELTENEREEKTD
ncbi:MAG: DNA polymerase III subunit delta [Lachnospiraceae bacterium]|nr:DNA polymerase III subunit delta [Lachnospiraceae bacterium]